MLLYVIGDSSAELEERIQMLARANEMRAVISKALQSAKSSSTASANQARAHPFHT